MKNSPYNQESYFDNMPETLSLDKWQKTVNLIIRLFDAPGAWIMQANTKGLEAVVASTVKKNHAPAGSSFNQETEIYCKKVMQTKKPLYVKNAQKEGGWENNPEYTDMGFLSYLGVPIQWPDGEMFGTLCLLDKQETNFSQDFVELMWQLKEVIDGDLHNMMLIKKLRLQSTTDELTSINNRRGFMKSAESLINHANRNNLSLSLMYFDLNNLKTVNDKHGHEAGDFLIKSFAIAIANSVRSEDIIARLGGDEFCFLGVYQSADKDKIVESRIQQSLKDLTLTDSRIENPSFSIGCKMFNPEDDLNIDKMLSETDGLMYENKVKTKAIQSKI